MKRLIAPVLIACLSLTVNFPSATAAVKQGALCKKVGQVSTASSIKYTCTKAGTKLIWKKGSKTTFTEAISETDLSKFSQVDTCRLKTTLRDPNHVGFPRTFGKIPSIGNHKAIALFVEFNDLPSEKLQMDEWRNNQIPTFEKFVKEMSYGKLTYKVDMYEKFLKINKSVLSYNLDTDHDAPMKPNADFYGLVMDAIRAADPVVDFSQYKFVNVVTASTKKIGFEGAMNLPGTVVDGNAIYEASFGPIREYVNDNRKKIWLLHEVGHMFGLMHPVNTNPRANPDGYPVWDAMINGTSAQPEYLSWHRFMLDWFSDSQVKCVDGANSGEYVVKISSLSSNNAQTKMLTIKLSETKSLVVESRRSNSLATLVSKLEGVLAYTVDQTINDYQGALKFIYDKPSRENEGLYTTMRAGSVVSVGKVNLTVLRNDKDGDYVKVTIQ